MHLNTVAVSLEQIIPNVVTVPASLNIGWSCPPTPEKRRDLACQTRAFVLRAVNVAACDALDAFLVDIVNTDWMNFSAQTKDIATKATTQKGGKEWSVGQRLDAICSELSLLFPSEIALANFANRWRNAVVHSTNARFDLDAGDRQALVSGNSLFSTKAGFDINDALSHFDNKQNPTLKEVTTFLAFMQDLCRAIDQAAIKKAAPTNSKMEEILKANLRQFFSPKGKIAEFWGTSRLAEWAESELRTNPDSRTQRTEVYRAKWDVKFGNLLSELGFVDIKKPFAGELTDIELGRLRSMSAKEFADELGLTDKTSLTA